jgi:hypothetical protein
MKKTGALIGTVVAGIAAWTGIGAAIAAGYIAYVVGIGIAVFAVWLLGWAVGLWMRSWNR